MSNEPAIPQDELTRRLEEGGAVVLRRPGKRQLGTYYSRPGLIYGDVWCNRCGLACDFEDTAAHNPADPGRSRLYIRAECHGEHADIYMTFRQWHEGTKGGERPRIVAFEDAALPAPPLEPEELARPAQLLLMDRPAGPQPSIESKI